MGRKTASEEELYKRALANGFKPDAHREADTECEQGKHVGKTIKDQERTLTRYVAFRLTLMTTAHADSPDQPPPTAAMARAQYLCKGGPAPDLATTKEFFRFLVSISDAVIHDRLPTRDSIQTATDRFFAGFARIAGTMTDAEDRSKVYGVFLPCNTSTARKKGDWPLQWIKKVLTQEGLVVSMHCLKNNIDNVDATRLLLTLWTMDDLTTSRQNGSEYPPRR